MSQFLIQPVLLTYNNYECVIRRINLFKKFDSTTFNLPLVLDNSHEIYFNKNLKLLKQINENSNYKKNEDGKNACHSILTSINHVNCPYFWFLGDDYPLNVNHEQILNILKNKKPDQLFFNYCYENSKKPVRKFNRGVFLIFYLEFLENFLFLD